MPVDGLFIHHLINEIKDDVNGKKIYKVVSINDTDYMFVLSSKKQLLISVNPSSSHIRFTTKDYIPSNSILSNYMQKHIQGGIIKNIHQYKNDRLIIIDYENNDELGYMEDFKIYIELMGKNSNLIITDKNDIILEAVKKSYLVDEHLIKTGVKYIPLEDNKLNPFEIKDYNENTLLQGVCKQALNEISMYSFNSFMKKEMSPCLINNGKYTFYYTNLESIDGDKKYFDSLSLLLEYYYDEILKKTNDSLDLLNTKKYLEKEIEKLKNKLEKQNIELENAKDISKLEHDANLLYANIHLIKPYQSKITVLDYYNNNEEYTIEINPHLNASENVNLAYNKIKKCKRTQVNLAKTIEDTKADLAYFTDNLAYLDFVKLADLKEIMVELGLRKPVSKNTKPKITSYSDSDGNIYYVGKNNVQNNYLTHALATKDDYFFHVKSVPGSHVILRGDLNDHTIKLASNLAAYFSKAKDNIHVCVDYTQVKWIKKVKGTKGSFVIYTHEKMYFSDPSQKLIEDNLTIK